MPLWNKSGRPPIAINGTKRNVIATPAGWVRRITYTDVHSNVRTKEETLVALGDLPSEVTMGNPDVTEIYTTNTTGGSILRRGRVNFVYVVYSEPLSIGASSSPVRLTVANTTGGNSVIATSNTNKLSITNANNTLVFKFKVGNTTFGQGTYKVQAQNMSNTAQHKVYSIWGGASETANLNISALVSNTLGSFSIVA